MAQRVRGAMPATARIFYQCKCTINGTKRNYDHDYQGDCDRSPHMAAEIDGQPFDIEKVWMFGQRISENEWKYQTDMLRWLREHRPNDVRCMTYRRVDLNNVDFVDG